MPLIAQISTAPGGTTNTANVAAGATTWYGGVSADGAMLPSWDITGYHNHAIQIAGTFTGMSFQVLVSLDGLNFETQGSAITAHGITLLTGDWAFMQIVATGTTPTGSYSITSLHRA
jgi:hypothetical protein